MRRKSAATLVEAAQKSVGIDGSACAKMELQLLLEDYYAKQEQLRKMTEVLEAETLKVQNVKKLLAVKGIGLITVAGFLAEVGEIGRFDPPNRPGSRPDWNMYPLFQRTHNPQTATGNKLGNNMGDKKALNPRRSRIITEMRNDPDITIAQLRVVLNCAETTVENNIAYLRKTDTSNELVRERPATGEFCKVLVANCRREHTTINKTSHLNGFSDNVMDMAYVSY